MATQAATQTALHGLLGNLRASNKSELTILLLGEWMDTRNVDTLHLSLLAVAPSPIAEILLCKLSKHRQKWGRKELHREQPPRREGSGPAVLPLPPLIFHPQAWA